jgi:hypothetical protein
LPAILVASTDAYADLWAPFFTLFRRYWPDCPYPVYLGSNVRTYAAEGVRPITVGEDIDWSTGFIAMVRRIDEPYILVLLEDYLLSAPVETARIESLYEEMKRRSAACMRVMPVPGAPAADPDFPDAGELPRGMPYRVSLQAAIWRSDELLELLRPGESPWEFELRGTSRSDLLGAPFLSIVRDGPRPLPYFITAVGRGVWQRDAVALCRREGVAVDLGARAQEARGAFVRRKARRYRLVLTERLVNVARRATSAGG